MTAALEQLFTPYRLGAVEVRNRIASTPHNTWFGEDGLVGERYIRYYEEKARGGVGLVVAFGSMAVHPSSPSRDWGTIENFDDAVLPGLAAFADRLHEHGTAVMAQLTHRGRRGSSVKMERPLVAPSAVPEGMHREIPRALDRSEIRDLVGAYAAAARRLQRAGFDGGELGAYSRHLIDQFWHPQINRRSDEYGGSFENRLRFAVEVISACRDAVGPDFVLGLRLSANEQIPDGITPEIAIEIAQHLEALGALNYFSLTGATGERTRVGQRMMPFGDEPRAVYASDVGRVRAAVGLPVLYAGAVTDPADAERLLAGGTCELVGMTRALIADPHLPNKTRAGRAGDVRPCLGIQEGCLGRNSAGLLLSCTYNPVTGREAELAMLHPARTARRVVIVGAGPAGLEAARVAARRGHRVVLLERGERPGGQVLVTAQSTFRPQWARIATWLEEQARNAGAELRTGVDATANDVLALEPDAVILASGSRPLRPEIPGADLDGVFDPEHALSGAVAAGTRCVVADLLGTLHAPIAAHALATRGCDVILTTPHHSVADLSQKSTQEPLYVALYGAGVQVRTELRAAAVARTNGRLSVTFHNEYDEREHDLDADAVVLAGGRAPVDGLHDDLRAHALPVHVIGDALAPRSLHDAVLEGTRAARAI
jgi:N,N-dimethylglycine/sarcosine dehydrogenase